MTSRDFCYWLQGFFEISGTKEVTKEQSIIIQNHLNLVFKHEIDPSYGDLEHQEALQIIHDGKQKPEKANFKPSETLLRC